MRPQGRAGPATLLALTGVYYLAGKLGLSLALVHASASPVWPPTGIALAAFLLLGRSVWPAILAGAFLVNITTEGSIATSVAIAAGNTLEGFVGAALVQRFAHGSAAFDRPRDIFVFVALAGLCSTAISPTIGIVSLWLGGFASAPDLAGIWLTWWLGDAGGAVVLAPAIVLWAQEPRPGWTRAQWLEASLLAAMTAGLGAIAFGGVLAPPGGNGSLGFLCLPPAIWTAFRFGRRETATAVLILSGLAVWGTLRSAPAFPDRENEALVLVQLFMGVVSMTSLTLAAVVSQRRRALEGLIRQAGELARSNAELDEFARALSQDLRSALRSIETFATWLARECRDDVSAEAREYLSMLQDSARQVGRLIDEPTRLGPTRSSRT